jgi:hypothetical protein
MMVKHVRDRLKQGILGTGNYKCQPQRKRRYRDSGETKTLEMMQRRKGELEERDDRRRKENEEFGAKFVIFIKSSILRLMYSHQRTSVQELALQQLREVRVLWEVLVRLRGCLDEAQGCILGKQNPLCNPRVSLERFLIVVKLKINVPCPRAAERGDFSSELLKLHWKPVSTPNLDQLHNVRDLHRIDECASCPESWVGHFLTWVFPRERAPEVYVYDLLI